MLDSPPLFSRSKLSFAGMTSEKTLMQPILQRIAASEALLHAYFFTEPLPAHHSELPIPQRARKPARHRPNFKEYDIDLPLEQSCIDPKLIAEFADF